VPIRNVPTYLQPSVTMLLKWMLSSTCFPNEAEAGEGLAGHEGPPQPMAEDCKWGFGAEEDQLTVRLPRGSGPR
jgi:hypothetical protein